MDVGDFEIAVFSVKDQGATFLLNGTMSVPKNSANMEFRAISKWIAMGNIPDPEFTLEEKLQYDQERIFNQCLEELKATNFLCYVDVWEEFSSKDKKQISEFRKLLRKAMVGGGLPDIPNIIKEHVKIERKV
jgi:hypothetical protein